MTLGLAGYYWIDPNGGCISDAVQVLCNFSSGAVKTCIEPLQKESELRSWSGESVWFSTFKEGFQVINLQVLFIILLSV